MQQYPDPELPHPWVQEFDPSSGRPYYFNAESSEVSWCRPGEVWSLSWDNFTAGQYWIDRDGNTAPLEAYNQVDVKRFLRTRS